MFFFNIVDNPLTLILKESFLDIKYIRRLAYLERLDIGFFIFLNIAMSMVKITDLIPENKLANGIFLHN